MTDESPKPGPYDTDRGEDYQQAEWLAGLFNRGIRFDHSTKRWHEWDAKIKGTELTTHRWAPDQTRNVENAVLEFAVKAIKSKNMTKKEGAPYYKLLNMASVARALEALATMDGYKTDGADWDQNENLLGCDNGIVDLRVNALVDSPGPNLLVTRTTGHTFKPLGQWSESFTRAPRFMEFLDQITSGDEALAVFYAMWFGYSLFGNTKEQRFLVLTGLGRNGKGALVTAMRHVFGEYNAPADSSLYMRSRFGSARSDGARADLIALKGKRLAVMSEPDGGEFNEEMLKAHTGGDPITARTLHSPNMLTWTPTHSITFLTNNPPTVRDVGPAMAARVMVADFRERYEGEKEDKGLYKKLEDEADGILAILCFAAKVWFDSPAGLVMPERIERMTAEYLSSNDPIGQAITEAFVIDRNAQASSRSLYDAFTDWYLKSGATDDPMGITSFTMQLGKRGLQNIRTRSGSAWRGIRPKTAVELADEYDG